MSPARALLAFALCSAVHAGAAAQSTLPTTKLSAGIHLITAEVASRHTDLARGLMFRESLAPNHGMLFLFEAKSVQCMWMRNTLIPLSVAFIDDDGSIVNIEDMQPKTENSHCSLRPVRIALEMERGWFAKRGLKPGARINGLPSLR
jgi:uncharacterized membrane protein (UPF0127 family)